MVAGFGYIYKPNALCCAKLAMSQHWLRIYSITLAVFIDVVSLVFNDGTD